MTEHSRSTFNCGRTVTLPNRPEVAEPQNRKLEAVNRRRTKTAVTPRRRALSEARQYAMDEPRRGHFGAQLPQCQQRHVVADLCFRRFDTADWPTTSCGILRNWPRGEKSLSRLTLRSTSPAKEALLSMAPAASGVAARLAPRAGLVVV